MIIFNDIFRKGYFLFEALIAVAILGAAVVSLVGSLQLSLKSIQYAKNQFQALYLTEGTLEELRAVWASNPADLNVTGNWQTLTSAGSPPLRDTDYQVRYRAREHTQWGTPPVSASAPVWTPPPIPAIPTDRLYVVEVEAIPLNPALCDEGATLSTLLGRRGP
ncbi:hypothetical protein KBA41_10310 [Candidatus Ozemobacteraceae bacterium]|nr:hypothetical protein [Candidatus Ozemobacteraceae bacterium]